MLAYSVRLLLINTFIEVHFVGMVIFEVHVVGMVILKGIGKSF